MHILESRNNSGEKEAGTFFHLSKKPITPCLVVSPEVKLYLSLWKSSLVMECVCQTTGKMQFCMFSCPQERGPGEEGGIAPVRPSVHSWEVSRQWSWEEHGKTMATRDGFCAKVSSG